MKAIVIGGGIIGASVAWRLAKDGATVTVFERGRLGQEASWAAQGLIGPQAEAESAGPLLRLCIIGKIALEQVLEQLVSESGVDPEYDRHGVIHVALDDEEEADLRNRVKWQREAGLTVQELSSNEARKFEPELSDRVRYALAFPNDWRLENRKLTQAFVNAASRAGVNFCEGAGVDAVEELNARVRGVRLYDGTLHEADVVINAAGSWAAQIRGLDQDGVEMRPIRGQILCFETRPETLKHSVFAPNRAALVPRRDGRLLAGSTKEEAGFNKTVTVAAMARIASGARDMLPNLGNMAFREAWAGLRPATKDFLPVIGPSPSIGGLLYASGHYRNGILLSALTAAAISAMVMGRKLEHDLSLFSPARFKHGQIDHSIKPNMTRL